MAEREPQESEVTLSTGKLLAIFLGLAVVCAVFFTMGYMLGRGGASSAGKAEFVTTVPNSSTPATKPSAGNKIPDTSSPVCVAGSANCPLTTNTSASNQAAVKPSTQTTPATQQTPSTSNTSSTSTKPVIPSVTNPPVKNPPAGAYMVQVAAVTKQEDADILVAALRRKQYPVFIVNNVPGDPLFHIQVGPFSDLKEAEAMRNRLVSEGYSAMVKK